MSQKDNPKGVKVSSQDCKSSWSHFCFYQVSSIPKQLQNSDLEKNKRSWHDAKNRITLQRQWLSPATTLLAGQPLLRVWEAKQAERLGLCPAETWQHQERKHLGEMHGSLLSHSKGRTYSATGSGSNLSLEASSQHHSELQLLVSKVCRKSKHLPDCRPSPGFAISSAPPLPRAEAHRANSRKHR